MAKTRVLSSASGKVATVRGNDVRFPNGLRLSYEDFRAGARPRHGRTVLVDLFGDVKASAEWSAIDHYFHVHGAEVAYAVDRSDRRRRWRLHGDGVVAEFDHRHFEVFDTIPIVAALLAWKVARILELFPVLVPGERWPESGRRYWGREMAVSRRRLAIGNWLSVEAGVVEPWAIGDRR